MKTTLKTGLIAVICLIAVAVNAQEKPVTFGVKAGVNLSNVNGDINENDAKFGFTAGVSLDYAFNPNVYLLTGLDFSMKGFKVSDITVQGVSESITGDLKLNLSYIQLPIHIGYKLDVAENTKVVFHAGPYLAYGVNGKWKAEAGGEKESANAFTNDAIENDVPKLKRFDFGLGLGVGAEFGKIGVNLGYDFGLVNVVDKYMFGDYGEVDASIKNMNGYLTIGYKF